jgi:signal transduction histidine kinase
MEAESGALAQPEPEDESTEQALLQLIAGNVQRVPLAIAFLVVVIASLCYTEENRWHILIWAIVVISMQYVRYLVLPALVVNKNLSGKKRLFQATMLSFVNGLIFASAILFFSDLDDVSKSVFTIVFLGLAQASVTTAVGYRPIIIAFVGPFLVALVSAWLFTSFEISRWIPPAMSMLICLYAVILLSMAGDIYDSFLRAHQIQFQLRDALESEKEANSAKTRFLAAASHDLRQPLHTLSLYSAALMQRPLDNKSAEIASSMNIALSDMSRELDSLLDMSKLDAGIVQLDNDNFECADSVQRIVNSYNQICTEKGIDLHSDFQIRPTMYSDRILFERVVRNVMDNAVKYTETGHINVSVKPHEKDKFQVIVEDTGIGISESDLKHVFQEFYQSNNPERDRNKGLGLGLAIVKRLTPMLSGTINIESEEQQFTRVTLTFPISHMAQAVEIPPDRQSLPLSDRHILIIDDDTAVRTATRVLFEGIGCKVSEAANTADAVTNVQTNIPDIALVDLRLPNGESGLNTVERIRGFVKDLPVIIITGESSPNVLRSLKSSGHPYLAKPIDKTELLEQINHILGSG